MLYKYITTFSSALLLSLLIGVSASAQRGELRGNVVLKKADGTSVKPAGALIEVYGTDRAAVYEGKTSKGGKFLFQNMPEDGGYIIVVSLSGAQPIFLTNVKAGRGVDYELRLSPGDGSRYSLQDLRTMVGVERSSARGDRSESAVRTLTARQIAQRSFPSVVLIVTEDAQGKRSSLGSGFFVQQGVLATNYHVIKDASRIYAKIVGASTIYDVTEVIATDKNRDLALVAIEGIRGQPLPLSDSSGIAVGDSLYVVGNPEGLEGTFSTGIISAIREGYIQITAPISHGSSGGPVLNDRGQVIGIAVGLFENGQNLNFAIPVSYLSSLMSQQP
ncbi:MAG: serine protease [Blastocatellia bacterium]|nr:serine protease [Blastocatellia bacterium]